MYDTHDMINMTCIGKAKHAKEVYDDKACTKSVRSFWKYSPSSSSLSYGLAVRIPGFHPGGPGSTPGMGTTYFLQGMAFP